MRGVTNSDAKYRSDCIKMQRETKQHFDCQCEFNSSHQLDGTRQRSIGRAECSDDGIREALQDLICQRVRSGEGLVSSRYHTLLIYSYC